MVPPLNVQRRGDLISRTQSQLSLQERRDPKYVMSAFIWQKHLEAAYEACLHNLFHTLRTASRPRSGILRGDDPVHSAAAANSSKLY